MSFSLLLPAAMAALGALLLPLLIHLARRSQMRPTSFAALRWLRRETRPQRRLRFEEWPLLLLRLLLIALLALWLARPALHGEQARPDVVVAVPGVDVEAVHGLTGEGVQTRWLAPGFPDLGQAPPGGSLQIASLLRQLDMELAADVRVTVAVPGRLEGLDAQRPMLSRPVEWRVLPGTMVARGIPERAPPVLAVRYGGGDVPGLRYLRAAALAWHDGESAPDDAFSSAPVAQPVDPEASHLVWLAPGPLPEAVVEWVEAGGVVLLGEEAEAAFPGTPVAWWRDSAGGSVVEGMHLGSGRMLRFTRPLTPARMPMLLEPDFPQRLREVLEGPVPAPASAPAIGHAPGVGVSAYPQSPRDLRPWLALLIALLFLAERWLATSPRRAEPAPLPQSPEPAQPGKLGSTGPGLHADKERQA